MGDQNTGVFGGFMRSIGECTDPALFNLALAVRRDFGLPTSIPTGAGETDGCSSVRGKKRTRAGKLDVDRCQQRLERFFTASAAVGFREANQ